MLQLKHIIRKLEPRPLEWHLAGTGLCSYRVRGVDGSCAKHLTMEFYTVVMLLTSILISIPSLQILPTVAFLFFFMTDSTDFPDCLLILLSIPVFTF